MYPSFEKRALMIASVALCSFALPNADAGSIFYVDDDAPIGGDGASWTSAFRYLQDALIAAENSRTPVTEICVAQGTYRTDEDEANPNGTGDRVQSFSLLDGLALRGGFAGLDAPDPDVQDIDRFETTLSGDLNEDDGPDFENYEENAVQIIWCNALITSASLEGLTITHGNGDIVFPFDHGGGITNLGQNLIVDRCRIVENYGTNGGGMGNLPDASATIIDCDFIGNEAVKGGGLFNNNATSSVINGRFIDNHAGERGGAIYYHEGSVPDIVGCTFEQNGGGVGGGALYVSELIFTKGVVEACSFTENYSLFGGAIRFEKNLSLVIDCVFDRNGGLGGVSQGGAVRGGEEYSGGDVSFLKCRFIGNFTGYQGGAIYLDGGSAQAINCAFVGNSAYNEGGAFYVEGNLDLISSSVVANYAWNSAGGLKVLDGELQIVNSIIWDNSIQGVVSDQAQIVAGQAEAQFSVVQGGWSGRGGKTVFDADPQFVVLPGIGPDSLWGTDDDLLGDLNITSGSPCIDAADNTAMPGSATVLYAATDLDGNPRYVDDPDTIDTGVGFAPIADMGAYEYQPGSGVCSADLDASGEVDFADLLILLDAWNTDDESVDLDGSGHVGFADLLILLSNWS